jgi:hypothetical protein
MKRIYKTPKHLFVKNLRVVRYHYENYYNKKTTEWRVMGEFRTWKNHYAGWGVRGYYDKDCIIAKFSDEDEAIMFLAKYKSTLAAKKLQDERGKIRTIEEISARWKDFETALSSLDGIKENENG